MTLTYIRGVANKLLISVTREAQQDFFKLLLKCAVLFADNSLPVSTTTDNAEEIITLSFNN